MPWAYINKDSNYIQDVCPGNPNELYHPEVAALYDTMVPDGAVNGQGWIDGELQPLPPPPPPPPPPPTTWTADDVRNGMTLAEKVSWDNDTVPQIVTAKLEFQTPRVLADATEILQMLVSANVLSQNSMNTILSK
jgi:hypothetical protein